MLERSWDRIGVASEMLNFNPDCSAQTLAETDMPKLTISRHTEKLLMDENLGYAAIVDQVVAEFPGAKTTTRSVASVAAVMRKKGVDVPMRRKSTG